MTVAMASSLFTRRGMVCGIRRILWGVGLLAVLPALQAREWPPILLLKETDAPVSVVHLKLKEFTFTMPAEKPKYVLLAFTTDRSAYGKQPPGHLQISVNVNNTDFLANNMISPRSLTNKPLYYETADGKCCSWFDMWGMLVVPSADGPGQPSNITDGDPGLFVFDITDKVAREGENKIYFGYMNHVNPATELFLKTARVIFTDEAPSRPTLLPKSRREPVADDAVRISCDFEKSCEAHLSRSGGNGVLKGQVENGAENYVDGIQGKGLRLSPKARYKLPLGDLLRSRTGTIMFWIKPLNWCGTDKGYLRLLTYGSINCGTMYMQIGQNQFYFGTMTSIDYVDEKSFIDARLFQKDQWTHVAFLWDWEHADYSLFVNGTVSGYGNRRTASELVWFAVNELSIGNIWNVDFSDASLVLDELHVCQKKVDITEVVEKYSVGAAAVKSQSIFDKDSRF